jgi:hypothetical protein
MNKTTSVLVCWHRRHTTPQAPPAERAHILLPPDLKGGSPMAALYAKKLPPQLALDDPGTLVRMRADIESIWETVRGSRRSIEEAHEAIARANEALTRGLSGRR